MGNSPYLTEINEEFSEDYGINKGYVHIGQIIEGPVIVKIKEVQNRYVVAERVEQRTCTLSGDKYFDETPLHPIFMEEAAKHNLRLRDDYGKIRYYQNGIELTIDEVKKLIGLFDILEENGLDLDFRGWNYASIVKIKSYPAAHFIKQSDGIVKFLPRPAGADDVTWNCKNTDADFLLLGMTGKKSNGYN